MSTRALTKRKSETNVTEGAPIHQNKRILTERIAAGMGVLRLSDSSQDAQGNSRHPITRTASTPGGFYNGPMFTPARPDLVSSFELTRPQVQSMDEDIDMSTGNTPYQQTCISQPQSVPIYSQQPHQMLSTAPKSTIMPGDEKNHHPIYPIVEEDDEEEKTPTTFKLNLPRLPEPSLEIPFLHNLITHPESRALILYSPPNAAIHESMERNRLQNKAPDFVNNVPPLPADGMMLD